MRKNVILAVMLMAIFVFTASLNAELIAHYTFDGEVDGATPDSVGANEAVLGDRVLINTGAGEAKVGAGALEMLGGGSPGPANGAISSNMFSWIEGQTTTMVFWLKSTGPRSGQGTFVSIGTNDAHGSRIDVKENSTYALFTEFNGFEMTVPTVPDVEDGNWHFVAVVAPQGGFGSDAALYVDGGTTNLNTGSPDTTHPIATYEGPLVFGDSVLPATIPASNRTPEAMIDDFQLYDEALSLEQIQRLYENPGLTLSVSAKNPNPANGASVEISTLSELSWEAPDPSTEPNLVSVDQFDLYYIAKPTADVIAEDPNWLDTSNITSVTDAANPYPFSADYDTTYFWRVDMHVTWDSNSITGTADTSEVIEGSTWTFIALPEYIPPVINSYDSVITVLDITPATLSATVTDNSETINSVVFTLMTDDAEFPDGANASVINTTTDNQNPTASLATDMPGKYKVKLEVSDGATTVEKLAEVIVYADACQAQKDSPSGWTANEFDLDGNCLVDILDFSVFAAQWLNDTSMMIQETYSVDVYAIPQAIFDARIEAESVDPEKVSDLPFTDDVGIRIIPDDLATGGQEALGYTNTDSFAEFTIDIPAAGTYDLYLSSAGHDNEAGIVLSFGTEAEPALYGSVDSLPTAASWDVYHYTEHTGALTFTAAGPTTFRITWTNGARNIDWFTILPQ